MFIVHFQGCQSNTVEINKDTVSLTQSSQNETQLISYSCKAAVPSRFRAAVPLQPAARKPTAVYSSPVETSVFIATVNVVYSY